MLVKGPLIAHFKQILFHEQKIMFVLLNKNVWYKFDEYETNHDIKGRLRLERYQCAVKSLFSRHVEDMAFQREHYQATKMNFMH